MTTDRIPPDQDGPVVAPPPAGTTPCHLPGAHGQPVCVRELGTLPCDECPNPTGRLRAPEPATPPAQQPATATAAPGVATDTSRGAQPVPGVLGRALLDGDGDLWVVKGTRWSHAFCPPEERVDVERSYGPVREVLLVDPAVGDVLAAAQRWFASISMTETAEEADIALALNALGDHPAEPAAEPYRICNGCGALLGDPDQDDGCPHCGVCGRMVTDRGPRCGRPAGHSDACSPTPVTADLAEPAPEPDSADQWGDASDADRQDVHGRPEGTRIVGTPGGDFPEPDDIDKLADMIRSSPVTWEHITERFPGLAHQIERVIDPDLRNAARPEPDSGTGWDRHNVERIIEMVATIPQGASGDGDQLRALLADRDDWRKAHRGMVALMEERAKERDEARAELAEESHRADLNLREVDRLEEELVAVRGECDRLREQLEAMTADRDGLAVQRDRALAERETAVGQARSRWQRIIELRQELATARRDAAALDAAAHSVWLHGKWRWLTGQMTTDEREAWADAVDRGSAQLTADDSDPSAAAADRWWRDGTRSVKPEQASGEEAEHAE